MKNCLVTKLKSVFTDPEKKMEYFGGTIVTLLGATANTITTVQIGQGVKAKFIDGDAHFVASDSDSTVIEDADGWITTTNNCYYKPLVATPVRVFIKPGTTVANSSFSKFLDLNLNKMSLYVPKIIALTNSTATDMTLHFKSSPGCFANMITVNLNGYLDGEINLDHLTNATNMFTFNVNNYNSWNITGHFSSLANMATNNGITNIGFTSANLEEKDIESFAEAFIVGKSNGNKAVIARAAAMGLTYNGQAVTYYRATVTVDSTAASGYTVTFE